jgi:hypothetical protein
LAIEYLQGLEGFWIGFKLSRNFVIGDGSYKWFKFVGCKSRKLASGGKCVGDLKINIGFSLC